MKYKSTRGLAPEMNVCQAIIKGIAADKGLYVPERFPQLDKDWNRLAQLSYDELAAEVLAPYLPEFSAEELSDCIHGAYDGKYSAPETVPVVKAGGAWFLELYHGPTAAFKDMALQLMPRLLTASIKKESEEKTVVILVSTSGDTGTAALKGFENVPGTQIVVFFPDGAVSPVQEAQMRTADGANAHVFSILGNFDDAQTTQKQILSDAELLKEMESKGFTFSAANSMNVGRLLPQIVYYVWGYAQLVAKGAVKAGDPVNICVPSGNFGNILSAYYAMRMGLPVKRFICASNKNKVLTDFINTGVYDTNREFYVTNAPSMDILVSSNLERLLFHLAGEDASEIRSLMDQLSENGKYTVGEAVKKGLDEYFSAGFATEEEVTETIGKLYNEEGYLMDTHTAVGYKVWKDYAEASGDDTPALIASTASPYKFAAVVAESIGIGQGPDPFETIDRLFAATGAHVPDGLKGLKQRKIIHKESIRKEDMKARVKALLGL